MTTSTKVFWAVIALLAVGAAIENASKTLLIALLILEFLSESWKVWMPIVALLVWGYGYWRNRQRQLVVAEFLERELRVGRLIVAQSDEVVREEIDELHNRLKRNLNST